MKNQIKEKTLITKCPKCGSRKFVISVFGNICGDCFYEEKAQIQENQIKERIIGILREIMSSSENRDWGREAHATKSELETMRNNNDNDFLNIADCILELFEEEKQKWEKKNRRCPVCECVILEEIKRAKQKWVEEIEKEIDKYYYEAASRIPYPDPITELEELKQRIKK